MGRTHKQTAIILILRQSFLVHLGIDIIKIDNIILNEIVLNVYIIILYTGT